MPATLSLPGDPDMIANALGLFELPGGWEILLILLVALLLFGRRLPEVARSLGRSIVEFKRGLRDLEHEIESASEPEPHETKQGGPTLPEDSQSQTDSSRSEQREQQS